MSEDTVAGALLQLKQRQKTSPSMTPQLIIRQDESHLATRGDTKQQSCAFSMDNDGHGEEKHGSQSHVGVFPHNRNNVSTVSEGND